MISDAMLLVNALRDPATTRELAANGWTALITIARAEQLIGTLAQRLQADAVPEKIAEILNDARTNAAHQKRSALWEADCAARALADYDGKVVLLKGTAYVAAGLQAGEGRHIGDLDILIARDDLPQVEALLLSKGGWEWVKEDAYDDAYYRDHMHELPPMIHKDRDRMIDVHHTILPLTAGPTPDAAAMIDLALEMPNGLWTLMPEHMIVHSAAHLLADGDLTGGLRNLWDIHCLATEFDETHDDFYLSVAEEAWLHGLSEPVNRALRLSRTLFGTALRSYSYPATVSYPHSRDDKWYIARLTARDHWGRPTRKITRFAFYIRSHWLRMPPLMLARHLFTKWRKAKDKK